MLELPAAIRIYFLILSTVLGASIGSFVNCVADRYVANQSVWKGRSHCPSCGHTLSILDLFPILSYIFLRGKCRYCGEHIPIRCLITELLGGVVFLMYAYVYGFSLETLEMMILMAILLAVALIDYDTMEIPDGLLQFGVIVFLLFLPAHTDYAARLEDGALGALIYGGGMLILSLIMDLILKKDSLGGGDIKMLIMLGLFTGVTKGLLNILLACVIGLLMALGRSKKDEEGFPFGPALAFAAMATLLVGSQIIDWYLEIIF